MLTPKQRKIIDDARRDPSTRERAKGMTDDEILAQYRFVENGEGIKVYANAEERRAARKMQKSNEIDYIDEV